MLKSQILVMKIPWPSFAVQFFCNRRCVFILGLIFLLFLPHGRLEKLSEPTTINLNSTLLQKLEPMCPKLFPKLFVDQAPKVGQSNSLKTFPPVKFETIDECIESCCTSPTCQMVFMFKNNSVVSCYQANCTNNEDCLPSKPDSENLKILRGKSFVALVRPSDKFASWSDVLQSFKVTPPGPTVCEVGLDLQDCQANEECIQVQDKSRNGVCQCKDGFKRDLSTNQCVSGSTTTAAPVRIAVNVASKKIQLPASSATLTAFTVPEAPPNTTFEYDWKWISGPSKGNMDNIHAQTLSLSNLEEGTYVFNVTVSGGSPPVIGDTTANVTVLAAQRVNKPPKAVVQPVTQIVNLPTSKAIIDGSGSQDDTGDLKYKWEILTGPVNYQHELPAEATLTLIDLVAGNYTIKLEVTDSDGASSTTLAHLQVNEEVDYPPTANAGEDVMLYLPNNEVDLHGNMSSDDHGIVGWEWTRSSSSSGGKELAADTTNMRTPHPHLSNLEEGVYTFTLKVTDVKGQSDEDEVNVYVKAPISLPPTADAGQKQEFSLPKNWALLDGSGSKDDVEIVSFNWTQLLGPNKAVFESSNSSKCNVTGLTKGTYVFKLTVKDNIGMTGESNVTVIVSQDSNSAPVADAGPDAEFTLPRSVVVINGSSSYDDLKIVRYLWTRLSTSLAAGKILGNSFSEPALLLVDLVPGTYEFQLQVWDEQGKSSTDKIKIRVNRNPEHANILQALLNVQVKNFTQGKLDSLCQSLTLLLRNDGSASVKVLDLSPQKDTGFVIIQFLMETAQANGTKVIVPGTEVLSELETKLKASQDILDVKILELDTLECQNPCSGHGKCQQATRTCICDHFWMENPIRRQFLDRKSNCDWSVIYVGIFSAIFVAAVICLVAFVFCKKKALKATARPRKRYTRLEQNDSNMEMRLTHTSSLMTSESDSEDDEITFDDRLSRRSKSATTLRNGGAHKKNGFAKVKRETNA